MFGRRSHSRYAVSSRPRGVLRVFRDVAVERVVGQDEVTAISRESGTVGDALVVNIPDNATSLAVEVVESRPVIVSGTVRHRLKLRRIGSTAVPGMSDS